MSSILLGIPFLLVYAAAINDVVVDDLQTNLTVGVTAGSVIACSYDSTGRTLMASQGNTLSFFMRDSATSQFIASYNLTMPGMLRDAALNSDATWAASIINSPDSLTSVLYLLRRSGQ